MRRLALIMAAIATMALLAAPPSLASPRPRQYSQCHPCTGYLQDGNGAGDAASLMPNAPSNQLENLFAEPVSVAWRWDMYNIGPVISGTFTYGPLENATLADHDDILDFVLHANNNECMENDSGEAVSDTCTGGKREQWVYDPPTGYWINVGRSNDENNWEILCNPGGGGALYVGTRDSCSDYHEEWLFNPSN